MPEQVIRLGLIGAGGNMKARHLPGFAKIAGVEIVAVCNRRPESTQQVAREYGIPKTYNQWEEVIADKDIDAVVIGTWPYLHCPITLAALEAGKHVLTEARMSMNAAEAHRMLAAARAKPELVTQIVPSPFGLKGHQLVKKLLADGYIGELREVHVYSRSGHLADPATPLSWRQDAQLSGYNMLTLGIVHETLLRWVPPPVGVFAQVEAFTPTRIDPQSGVLKKVGTPDSVQVVAVLANGARATYNISGVTPFSEGSGIYLFGTAGALHYDLSKDRIKGLSQTTGKSRGSLDEMEELTIPDELAGGWRVEEDFLAAIREGKPIEFTDFETGVVYMEFTEAVARSAEREEMIDLPLEDLREKSDWS